MEETKLRQLFKNRADAYLNTINESVEQGMSEDCFIKAVNEAINYSKCCETVKDKQAHTFEVDPEKWNSAYDRCNEIKKVLKAPSRIFMHDGENYIELKP
jgi:hypothetical protein